MPGARTNTRTDLVGQPAWNARPRSPLRSGSHAATYPGRVDAIMDGSPAWPSDMSIALMLATLTDRRAFDDGWLLERKLDGERCVARKDGGEVLLESRTGKDLTGTYPEIRASVKNQRPRQILLDGEVVAYDGEQTSFSRLQQRLGTARPSPAQVAAYPVVYCVFDLLELDGEALTERPLLERRARLASAVRPSPALQITEAWHGDSERRFAEACRSGWEGLVAKRVDAPYTLGRSTDWLKLKCVWEQEFVIGGFTEPAGSRTDFGALLVGYHEDGRLRYAGKVGTGYSVATLRDLGAGLRAIETPESPFVDARPVPRGTHWTRPELVGQIAFAEWTTDGRLRQPRFLGLRDDKAASDVVRERAR
ncbi:MAG: ATP-dependent ligase [Acidimicrobiales bacterium]|nr:ATP-dependent ligase [Acidimicrobiales bacterium]